MKPRIFGNEGFVHITNRGVGKMVIFEEAQDYKYFISLLSKAAKKDEITVCAYCLMDNHVHLLLHYTNKNVSRFMQRVSGSYARYYNIKYEHAGHVFQGRFDMENIFDEQYFLTVNRYIIQNPEKAGVCSARSYRWSSLVGYDSAGNFVDISLAVEILGGLDRYYEFVTTPICSSDDEDKGKQDETSKDPFMDYDKDNPEESGRFKQARLEISEFVKHELGIKNVRDIREFDRKRRDEAIHMLKSAGFSIRSLERLTGIGRSIIHRA